jgi:hypothetical protein
MRRVRIKTARAQRPIDVIDNNVSSSLQRASELQITIIRAR